MSRLFACGSAALVLMLAACAGKLPPPATPADVQWAQSQWPTATAADLEAGRQVLLTKCDGCHRPHLPEEFAPSAWPTYLTEMAPRAKLTAQDRAVLEQYVITLSNRGK